MQITDSMPPFKALAPEGLGWQRVYPVLIVLIAVLAAVSMGIRWASAGSP